MKQASTRQDKWVTVDHMFYTTSFSDKYRKHIEDRLQLLSRLELPRSRDCERLNFRLPDGNNPSDHLPLVAKFLLRN